MNKVELVNIFLMKLGVEPNFIVKKSYGKSPAWSAELLVKTLMEQSSATEVGKVLGASKDTVNLYTTKLVGNSVLQPKGQRTWGMSILDSIQYKLCNKCQNYKNYTEFSTDNTKQVGKHTNCKSCCKVYDKEYTSINSSAHNAKGALYRARKFQATPKWVQLDKIKTFYENCPKGYHVDHIVPLQSELVCGLHVIENLQYLTVEENLQKSNKFEII